MGLSHVLTAAFLTAGSLLLALPAQAQSAGDPPPGAGEVRLRAGMPPGDWRVSVGAAGIVRPDYLGSNRYRVTALPSLDIRYRDLAFVTSFGGLPGAGVNVIRSGGLLAGPIIRLRFSRDEGANPALRGLGDVGVAAEIGGFIEYRATNLRVAAEVRRGVGGHEGVVASIRADAVLRPLEGLTVSFGPRLNLGDAEFTRTYFGITAQQSARSGYARFKPSGGVTSVGAGVFANYALTRNIAVQALVEYQRLQADAANSPIVSQRGNPNQVAAVLSATYAFNW